MKLSKYEVTKHQSNWSHNVKATFNQRYLQEIKATDKTNLLQSKFILVAENSPFKKSKTHLK